MRRLVLWLCGAGFAVALSLVSGCGPIEEYPGGGGGTGPICYNDSDCVPDDCCGEGGGVVHIQDAPDCRGVVCSGVCPTNQVNCGCGYPVCRNSHCAIAVNYSDDRCVQ